MGDKMLNINNIEIKKVFLGDKELNKIFLGNYLIYSKNQSHSFIKLELSDKFKSKNKMSNNIKSVKEKFIIDINNKKIVELTEDVNKIFIANLNTKEINDNYISDEAAAKGTGFTDTYTKVRLIGMRTK